MAKAKDFNDFIGNKYNLLKVLCESEKIKTSGGNSKRTIKCLCDCGIIKDYNWQEVINGKVKSCGCYSKQIASERMVLKNTKHGMIYTSEYNSWQSMKKRCSVKSHKSFKLYGGRGIRVCNKWESSFISFINDMGMKPSKNYSLDRIDNNKGYFKENCRWATKKQQCQNTRTNRNIEYKGETKCVSEWARILDMSYAKLYYRLFNAKYTVEKAFAL